MKIKRTKGLLLVCSMLAAGCIAGGVAFNIDTEMAKPLKWCMAQEQERRKTIQG